MPNTVEGSEGLVMIEFASSEHKLHQLLQEAAQHVLMGGWIVEGVTYTRTKEADYLRFFISGSTRELPGTGS